MVISVAVDDNHNNNSNNNNYKQLTRQKVISNVNRQMESDFSLHMCLVSYL